MTDPGLRRYRSVFISDIHLGTRGCQAELLLDFIRHIECDHLYLVGDIIDGWKMKGGWFWPQSHNDVVQKFLRLARKGVTVNSVSPGYCETALVMAVPEDIRAKIIENVPVGRLGKPSEIARTVEFLTAEDAGFITGANIPINGRLFMSF